MEISLNALIEVFGLVIAVISAVMAHKCLRSKVKKSSLVAFALVIVAITFGAFGGVTYLNTNPSYDLGAYPDEEKYYLGIEVTEDGKFTYINPNDFSTTTVDIDLDKALIAGRINTIGLNNRYKKYKMVGPLKITWDSYEDMVMLSKFTAIQLGLMEATGAEDEQEFVIATGEAAEEFLESKAQEMEEANKDLDSTDK